MSCDTVFQFPTVKAESGEKGFTNPCLYCKLIAILPSLDIIKLYKHYSIKSAIPSTVIKFNTKINV